MIKNPDAVVIGAGVVGAATALSLTNAGLKVLVIDRGNVANGTTSAGEGNILVSDKAPGSELELAFRSRNAWFEVNEDIGGGFELEAKGGLVVARSEIGLTNLYQLSKEQRNFGLDAQDISISELRSLEPNLSHTVSNGTFYPQDSQCQPMLAAAQMLRAVKKRGGELLFGANITALETSEGRISAVVTSQGRFTTPIVVNATGTWAGEIAELAGSYLPIAPRRGFILVTAPAPKIIFHKVYSAEYVANVARDDSDLQSSAVVKGTQNGTILIGVSRERIGFREGPCPLSLSNSIALSPLESLLRLPRCTQQFMTSLIGIPERSSFRQLS